MEEYVKQLLSDIATATENARFYFPKRKFSYREWVSEEEEEKTAIEKQFDELTGIRKILLPPEDLLTDNQVEQLLSALEKLIEAYHYEPFFIYSIPDRLRYTVFRENLDQTIKIRNFYQGNFELCKKDTLPYKCALGQYCHCAFGSGLRNDSVVDFVMSSEINCHNSNAAEQFNLKEKAPDSINAENMDLPE